MNQNYTVLQFIKDTSKSFKIVELDTHYIDLEDNWYDDYIEFINNSVDLGSLTCSICTLNQFEDFTKCISQSSSINYAKLEIKLDEYQALESIIEEFINKNFSKHIEVNIKNIRTLETIKRYDSYISLKML